MMHIKSFVPFESATVAAVNCWCCCCSFVVMGDCCPRDKPEKKDTSGGISIDSAVSWGLEAGLLQVLLSQLGLRQLVHPESDDDELDDEYEDVRRAFDCLAAEDALDLRLANRKACPILSRMESGWRTSHCLVSSFHFKKRLFCSISKIVLVTSILA